MKKTVREVEIMQLKLKHKINLKSLLYCISAFLVPVIVMLLVYKKAEIYPFGENSILALDLWGQYFPILQDQAKSGGLISSYSFGGGLGFNAFAQSAYYSNSLFNIFYQPFESFGLINAIDFLAIFKFGFSSLTCAIYLKYHFKSNNPVFVAGASAYSLCAYSLAYISQLMWTDAIIFLPIIILGIERLVDTQKPLTYCIALALTIYSNFYIGFCVCIFCALYFLVYLLDKTPEYSLKKNGMLFARFAVFSLLAAGICAFSILPTYSAIGLTAASEAAIPTEIKTYHTFADFVYALFPFTENSLEYGVPNIATGTMVLILLPIYYFNRKIKFKSKLIFSSLLLALYFSMNLNVLDFIWHGLHFPNQLPGRWTFMFSFTLVLMVTTAIKNREGISVKAVFLSWISSIAIINFAKYALDSENTDYTAQFNYVFVFVTVVAIILLIGSMQKADKDYGLLFSKIKTVFLKLKHSIIAESGENQAEVLKVTVTPTPHFNKFMRNICPILLTAVIIFDIANSAITVQGEKLPKSDITSFAKVVDTVQPYADEYAVPEDDFYRMEASSGWTFNPGLLWGYNGMNLYSSVLNARTYNLLKDLGNGVYARNLSTVYNTKSPVLNSMFSVKYILNRDHNYSAFGMTEVSQNSDCDVYENQYVLPIAFAVSDNMLNWSHSDKNLGLDEQNSFFNSAVGSKVDVYQKITRPQIQSDSQAQFMNYTVEKSGHIFLQQNTTGTLSAFINGGSEISIDNGYERVKYIGYCKIGDTIKIALKNADIKAGGVDLYRFDENKFLNSIGKLRQNTLDVTYSSDTKICGKITANGEQLIYTSIPDDGGWSVYCDGKKIDTVTLGDSLVAFKVADGTHEIEFKYSVPNLAAGTVISILLLLILILLIMVEKQYKRIKQTRGENHDETQDFADSAVL